jgi:hypothetical protein
VNSTTNGGASIGAEQGLRHQRTAVETGKSALPAILMAKIGLQKFSISETAVEADGYGGLLICRPFEPGLTMR